MGRSSPNDFIQTPDVRRAIKIANWVGERLRGWNLARVILSEERILQAARRQTSLDDLGDERFRVPLCLLVDSYENDPELTTVGRLIARALLVHHVANRLRIHHDLNRHPEILAGEIRRPLFVVGLPRTGTTLLYNLLALDSSFRPLLFWESMSPSPPPDSETRHRDPRIAKAARTVAQLNRAVPTLRAIHEMNPRGPDECLGLLLNTFVNPFFRGRLPGYRAWLYSIGEDEVRAAYCEYRRQLLLLQWKCSAPHWLLKCPSHLFGLEALLAVLPDACVVQTHRDPIKAVPSLCSLTAALDGMSYKRVDMAEVGRRDVEIVEQLLDRGLNACDAADHSRFLHVRFRDLLDNPWTTVRQIYDHFGYRLPVDMKDRVDGYLAANPRYKHGQHRYRLEDFGLDRESLGGRFAAYCSRFQIDPE